MSDLSDEEKQLMKEDLPTINAAIAVIEETQAAIRARLDELVTQFPALKSESRRSETE